MTHGQYQTSHGAKANSSSPPSRRRSKRLRSWQENYDGHPITADSVLAAIRRHDKYLRTVPPRDYEMRAFEDGSVFFRNTKIPGLEKLFSLNDIIKVSRRFCLGTPRPLWKCIRGLWI
jgi:hypothetical protein